MVFGRIVIHQCTYLAIMTHFLFRHMTKNFSQNVKKLRISFILGFKVKSYLLPKYQWCNFETPRKLNLISRKKWYIKNSFCLRSRFFTITYPFIHCRFYVNLRFNWNRMWYKGPFMFFWPFFLGLFTMLLRSLYILMAIYQTPYPGIVLWRKYFVPILWVLKYFGYTIFTAHY